MHTRIPLQLREIVAPLGPGNVIINPPELPGRTVRLLKPTKLEVFVKLAGLKAPELVATAEAHFAALGCAGVRLPHTEFYLEGDELFIVADQVDGWPIARPRPTRFSRQPFVRPHPGQEERPISAENRQHYTNDARAGLQTYGQIVASPAKDPKLGTVMLYEPTPDKQWMVGTLVTDRGAGEGLIMVDPDPALIEADAGMLAAHTRWSNELWTPNASS